MVKIPLKTSCIPTVIGIIGIRTKSRNMCSYVRLLARQIFLQEFIDDFLHISVQLLDQ